MRKRHLFDSIMSLGRDNLTKTRSYFRCINIFTFFRVTIDTLEQLVSSKLTYGGCGELNREFFKYSPDPIIQMIENNFIMVNSSEEAVSKVAQSSFAFYENIYFLKKAIVKQRDKMFQSSNDSNSTQMETQKETRNLHIMNDCVINVPASLGMYSAYCAYFKAFSFIPWRKNIPQNSFLPYFHKPSPIFH